MQTDAGERRTEEQKNTEYHARESTIKMLRPIENLQGTKEKKQHQTPTY